MRTRWVVALSIAGTLVLCAAGTIAYVETTHVQNASGSSRSVDARSHQRGIKTSLPAGSTTTTGPPAPASTPTTVASSTTVVVPQIDGRSTLSATAALFALGLNDQIERVYSPGCWTTETTGSVEWNNGFVLGQTPLAGIKVAHGTAVTIKACETAVTVPGVTGKSLDKATAELHADGFAVDPYNEQCLTGPITGVTGLTTQVVNQNPYAGVEVPPGSTVEVWGCFLSG
jgi:hypothetical protein